MRAPSVRFVTALSSFVGFRPRFPLDRALALVWFAKSAPDPTRERVLPNGVVEVILNLGPPQSVVGATAPRYFRRAWVAGVQCAPLDLQAPDTTDLVGLRFRPGGLAPFVGFALSEVRDEVVELDDARWLGLRAALGERRDDEGRLQVIEEELSRWLLAARRVVDPRVAHASVRLAAHDDGLSMRALAAEVGVSHKHLVELFGRDVGVGPKMLGRILRFARVLHLAERGGPWTTVAHACGYADQPHLNAEFRIFAGVTPTEYRRRRTEDPEHVTLG